jgi:hypothetical protein
MSDTTSATSNAAPTRERWCVYVDATMQVPGGYRPAVITHGQPGFIPLGDGARGWIWGPSLEQAKATAREVNTALGLTEADVSAIVASSMTAESCPPPLAPARHAHHRPDATARVGPDAVHRPAHPGDTGRREGR